MGVVYRARHELLDELVALKIPNLERALESSVRSRMLREARAAARLTSAHSVRIRDVDTLPDGTPYIVMEYLEGRDLGQVLREDGAQPIQQVVRWVLEACEALAESHARDILHRDIKPSNLFLSASSEGKSSVKVLDFGVALAFREALGEELTGSGELIGSPRYMSPEQVRRSRELGPATDIWSLGVVLFELLTNHRPFEADSSSGVLAAITADPPEKLRKFLPHAPAGLEEVVLGCLEKRPEDRHADVVALARALAPFCPRGDELAKSAVRAARRGSVRRSEAELERTHDPIETAGDQTASNWGQPTSSRPAPAIRSHRKAWLIAAVTASVLGTGFILSRSVSDEPSPATLAPPASELPLATPAESVAIPTPSPRGSSTPTAKKLPTPSPLRRAVATPSAKASVAAPAATPSSPPIAKPKSPFQVDETVDTRL